MKLYYYLFAVFALCIMSTRTFAQNPFYPKCKVNNGKVSLNFRDGHKFDVDCVIRWDELNYYLDYLQDHPKQEVTFAISDMSRWNHKNRNLPLNYFSQSSNILVNIVLIGGPELISIGGNSFEDCYALKSIYIPKSVYVIGGNAFKGCRFSSITLPKNVTRINSCAFINNPNLVKVVFEGHPTFDDNTPFNNTNPDLTIYVKKKYLSEYKEKYPFLHFEKL